MLERTHVGAAAVFVHHLLLVRVLDLTRLRREDMASMEDLVQTVAARVHLQWVREHDKDRDGELADRNE